MQNFTPAQYTLMAIGIIAVNIVAIKAIIWLFRFFETILWTVIVWMAIGLLATGGAIYLFPPVRHWVFG